MRNQIRVLAIAPYEAMKEQLERAAQLYGNIELSVFVGDLEEGAEIAKSNFHADYDVILSRGGTAKLIQDIVPLPVVEIDISLYDILCAFKLAQSAFEVQAGSKGRIAIVGFGGITKNAHLLCEVLNFKLDVYTIEAAEMVRPILQQLQYSGCTMVLCDMVASTTAKQMGLNTILINSGSDSIRSAFDQVLRLVKSYDALREENHFLRQVILNQGTNTVVYDEKGRLFFSTLPEDDEAKEVLQMLRPEIEDTVGTQRRKILRNKKGMLYTIFAQRFHTLYQTYVAFFFTARKAPPMANRCGVEFSSPKEVEEQFYNSLYSMSGADKGLPHPFSETKPGSAPLMILGEDGTGKEQAMYGFYLRSAMRGKPLIKMNCALLNEKTWDFLVNSPNSPLSDTGNTLYFKSVDALNPDMARELIAALQVMEVGKRNQLFLSCMCAYDGEIPAIGQEFIRQLDCLVVTLPTLRERAQTLPALISLYLNRLNPTLDQQIAGIVPEGLRLLQSYPWPHNYIQFKRLLREMAMLAKGPIISASEVRQVLVKEKNVASVSIRAEDSSRPLDLTKPLAEINREIVKRVLSDTGNNQSTAAKRLGISRTTLWRMIQAPQ